MEKGQPSVARLSPGKGDSEQPWFRSGFESHFAGKGIDWQRDGVTALRIDGEDRSLVLHGALRTEGERSDADAVDFLVFFAVEVDPPLLGIGTDEVLKRLRSPEPLVRHQTVNDLAMQVHHRAGS